MIREATSEVAVTLAAAAATFEPLNSAQRSFVGARLFARRRSVGAKGLLCSAPRYLISPNFWDSQNSTRNKPGTKVHQATILHCLGLERLTFPKAGLDFKLTGVEPCRVAKEILA